MNETTNLKLGKPLITEKYSISVFNNNCDIIDSAVKQLQDEVKSTGNELAETAKTLADEISRAKSEDRAINTALSSHALNNANPHGVTKEQIGLGNADNTCDTDKPVSTAQQSAIDLAYSGSNAYTDAKIAALINGAPSTLDTLGEIADAMASNESVVEALDSAIGTKANQAELDTHTANDTIHITSSERSGWNAARTHAASAHAPASAEENVITSIMVNKKPLTPSSKTVNITIPTKISELDDDSDITGSISMINTEITVLKKSVSDGKSAIASAITNRGVPTESDASFETMAGNISEIASGTDTSDATASASNILYGKTAYSANGKLTGTMSNYSNSVQTVTPGASQTGTATFDIADGYHTQIKVNSTNVYNAGITYADGRVNTSSTNYKTGYNAGYSAGKSAYKIISWEWNGLDWTTSNSINVGTGYSKVYVQINRIWTSDGSGANTISYSYNSATGTLTVITSRHVYAEINSNWGGLYATIICIP